MPEQTAVLYFPDIEVGTVRDYAERTGLPLNFLIAAIDAGRLDAALMPGREPSLLRFAKANAVIDGYTHMTRRPANGRS